MWTWWSWWTWWKCGVSGGVGGSGGSGDSCAMCAICVCGCRAGEVLNRRASLAFHSGRTDRIVVAGGLVGAGASATQGTPSLSASPFTGAAGSASTSSSKPTRKSSLRNLFSKLMRRSDKDSSAKTDGKVGHFTPCLRTATSLSTHTCWFVLCMFRRC